MIEEENLSDYEKTELKARNQGKSNQKNINFLL